MKDRSFLAQLDRLGPVLVTLAVLILALAYMGDAYAASKRIHNLIMLVPMTAIVVVLAAIIFIKELGSRRIASRDAGESAKPPAPSGDKAGASASAIAAMMMGLLAYAMASPWIGFDVASILFLVFCLFIQGERRLVVLAAFSIPSGLAVTWLLINGARSPVPTMIVPGL